MNEDNGLGVAQTPAASENTVAHSLHTCGSALAWGFLTFFVNPAREPSEGHGVPRLEILAGGASGFPRPGRETMRFAEWPPDPHFGTRPASIWHALPGDSRPCRRTGRDGAPFRGYPRPRAAQKMSVVRERHSHREAARPHRRLLLPRLN